MDSDKTLINEKPNFLHSLFEFQVQNSPQQTALICETKQYSYAQLDQAANQFAHYLKKNGIRRGDCVGVLLERSADMYTILLGILKVGAAYVPLDSECPAERVNHILADCDAKLLVTNIHFAIKYPSFPCLHLIIESARDAIGQEANTPIDGLADELNENDLCYIIYTSGSTGKPKGVQITHKNVANYIHSASSVYQISASDRIYQGFSIAFDASVEEIWLGFANGSTLIAGTDKTLRSGIGLIEFLKQHEVTVLSCVPTLLAILEPSINSLRLLILGGEVCSADLIKRWSSPNLKILNTYGPTEATVVTTYSECHPDKPVTIGKPLPNYEVMIIDENLMPVSAGTAGELCISGACLTKGYLNRPDLNQTKFISNPALNNKRHYRTGDLCRLLENGEIQFLGRIDDQVKLRGFRIELSEIEAVIKDFSGIANAAVITHELSPGVQSLVAYLMPHKKAGQTADIKVEQLTEHLHAQLPDYMMPSIFEIIVDFPLLTSGKIDRKNLPKPHFHNESNQRIKKEDFRPAKTDIEKKITAAWEELFNHDAISIDDDFFYDLNGHSLLAAKAVSSLRKLPEFESISMLDIYQKPTIAKLAEKFSGVITDTETNTTGSTDELKKNRRDWRYYACATGQFFGCALQYFIPAWMFLFAYMTLFFFPLSDLSIILRIIGLIVLLPLVTFVIVIAAKWLLLGRVKPGEYRLWGWFYFRWWLVTNMQKTFLPLEFLIGSPFIIFYSRLMGAKIGKNCHINSAIINTFDLLNIADNTSIGYDATILGYEVENGWLKIGAVSIGKKCFVGSRAVLSLNTVMEDNAVLEDLSMLPSNNIIKNGKHFHGSPARERENIEDHQIKQPEIFLESGRIKNAALATLQLLGLIVFTIMYYATFLPGVIIIDHFYKNDAFLQGLIIGTPIGGISSILLTFAATIIIKKLLIGKIRAGQYKIKSLFYVRSWIVERFINNHHMEILSDSLYFPVFLRLLGAKIGKRVESGELAYITPDLLTMKDESFNASWISLGAPRVYGGYINYGPVTIGKRGFVGNCSLLPNNSEIGDGALLGCLTIPPIHNEAKAANTSWFGTPAIFLPKRELFAGFSDKHTYHPPKLLYLTRLIIEFIRIVLPSTFVFTNLIGIFWSIDFLHSHFSLFHTFLLFPLFELVILFALGGLVILLKWILMGKLKPDVKPIWNVFIWKYDLVQDLSSEVLVSMVMTPLYGTPFAAIFYRLLGCKIGKGVFINTQDFTEWDLIDIGDDVALNEMCTIQTHLYEDRIFKMANIRIQKCCNVGSMAVVLYDTVMEPYSTLGPLSLLMKGETLPARSVWCGVPAQFTKPTATMPIVTRTETVNELVTQNSLV